ncbi:baseplate J/gp47 family protein [Bacillus sp. JJ722]|uniref:baseplate J/gp47 family protein n=1 Tax=Bacillus sp. JJ722 TaxID=3122973 RepID=UPI002FFFB4D1
MSNRTKEIIHAEMIEGISNDYEKAEGSFIWDSTKASAKEHENTNKRIDEVASKLSIENLKGEELEKRIYELTGQEKKKSTKSSDYVEITGRPSSVIYVGDKVAADNVFYSSLEEKVIDSTGKVLVLVECDQFGTIGNVPANAITLLPVTLPGIISVTNPQPFTDGYEAESDEDLIERYYDRIRTPATSNNKHHFRNWAREVTGVGEARVFPLWNGDNTVKVVIIDSNMLPASQELIDAVQEHIDPGGLGLGEGKSSLGSFCTVVSAIAKNINISFTVIAEDGYSIDVIKQNVSKNIIEYLKKIAFNQSFVSYAQIGSVILESEGVTDYSNLLVNDDVVNVPISEEEVAVLGGVLVA